MKKLGIIFFSLLLFSSFGTSVIAQSPQDVRTEIEYPSIKTQRITAFDVTANLTKDRLFIIKEEIKYDFGDMKRHGIFRNIPEAYTRNGRKYDLRYRLRSVTRDGKNESYTQSHEGDVWMLKIGREDVELTGEHIYVIEYETGKAINFFDQHTELYWNVTGNDWPIPIDSASFTLHSPLGNTTSSAAFLCYTGIAGSIEQACSLLATDDALKVTANRALASNEGLSVVFGFPPGIIQQASQAERFWEALRDNWIIFFPIIALFAMIYLWWTRGKDPEPETVIPQYEIPADMSPIVLSAALGGGMIPQRGITAAIIDMARRGYLHIEYGTEKKLFGEKQTYTFIKKNKPPVSGNKWDTILWNGLFKNGNREKADFKDLQADKFYNDVQTANKAAEDKLKTLGIFEANPYTVRVLYILAAGLIGFIVGLIGADAPIGIATGIATGIIIAIFGWFMPKRTKKGTSLVAEVKGFKWFLSVTEKERLKFHNAPSRTPQQFMEFLPAAIALGVEKAWAEQFKDLHIEPPDWAEGNVSSWTPILLANSISDMNTASAAAVYSPPSQAGGGGSGFSSGGGFSGGGMGGGGGGSW